MENKMVIHQPQPVMEVQNSQEWGTGICDCCQDVKECCFAFWCCPCFACITSKKYGEHLCLPLLEVFSYGIPAITLAMRTSMRQRYHIEGSIPRDCLLATFCASCVWCQMSREIKRRNIQIILVNAKTS
ncbi:cornifelin homolog B-like [Fundulus diaphanus]